MRLTGAEYQRRYRQRHRERVLAAQRVHQRSYRERHPGRVAAAIREHNRTTRHGITRLIRDWMYESQDGACAGCGTPYENDALDIDHDHDCCPGSWSCGRCVRGLLCRSCNVKDVLAG